MTRNTDIDFLKGVAIILMVMGHALTDWGDGATLHSFISMFHMPVFFIAAGYFFNGGKVSDINGLRHYAKSRAVRLGGVYVFWVCVFIMLNNTFLNWNIYTDNDAIRQYVPGMTDVHKTMGLREICKSMLFAIPMVYRPEPVVPFWFLKSLFVISIGYASVEFAIRCFGRRNRLVIHSVIALIMLVLFRYHPSGRFMTLMFYLGGGGTFYGWFLFHVGRVMHDRCDSFMPKSFGRATCRFLFAMASLLVIHFWAGCWKGHFVGPEWSFIPAFVICSFSGWILLLSISRLAMTYESGHHVIEYFGQHTMPILILHLIAFKLVNYVGVLLHGDPFFVIAGFPASYHGSVWTIIYTFVGISIPLILEYVWRRVKGVINENRLSICA